MATLEGDQGDEGASNANPSFSHVPQKYSRCLRYPLYEERLTKWLNSDLWQRTASKQLLK